jgi:hypothetical protein
MAKNYAREVSLFATDKPFMHETKFKEIQENSQLKALVKSEGNLTSETRFWQYHWKIYFVYQLL